MSEWHPNCRCYVIPAASRLDIFGDHPDLADLDARLDALYEPPA